VADFNKDGIPVPTNSAVADGQPGDSPSGLSVSRRVKIGIVLLLMLCGYFLLEDRPRPVTLVADSVGVPLIDDSQMQAFMDDLDFVETNETQQQSPGERRTAPLTLPTPTGFVDPFESTGTSTPSMPSGLQQNNYAPATDSRAFSPEQSHAMRHQPPAPVRPMVRFTGRIETIR